MAYLSEIERKSLQTEQRFSTCFFVHHVNFYVKWILSNYGIRNQDGKSQLFQQGKRKYHQSSAAPTLTQTRCQPTSRLPQVFLGGG